MSKIGIYGGTFNPIHNTHVDIALLAKQELSLDKLFFLVAGLPPHKNTAASVSSVNRKEMVDIVICQYEGLYIDDRELFRSGKSYSYITLLEYKTEYPNDEIYFIMGSDSLLNFDSWVKPDIISSIATIVCVPRLGDNLEDINKALKYLNEKYEGRFISIDYTANGISSTVIRDNIFKGLSLKGMIPSVVEEYIKEHNLYTDSYDEDYIKDLTSKMENELKSSRYLHTLGVANMAYSLAIRWNYPVNNAMVAGLLHDCAKCLSDEKRIKICKDNKIKITDIESKYPHLLHAKVGAYLAKEKYGINNTEILHAIEVHTTGCINMNLIDKIIYVADYIEPLRNKQPRLDIIRKVAFEDLDLCVYMILEDSINYLSETPDSIDPTTFDTYKFEKEKRGL